MRTKLLSTLTIIAILTTSSVAWDKEIPTECKDIFKVAMDAKGTSKQDETFKEFLECTEEFEPETIETMVKQRLCYNFQYNWIGEDDFSCSPLNRKRG